DGSTVFKVYYDRNYYAVNFNLGDGGYGVEPVYAKYESVYRIDHPQRMGYTFLGWARTNADSSNGEEGVDWYYIDADGNKITKTQATASENLVQLEGDQYVPAKNTYYKAIWSAGTSSLSVVFWVENANSELTDTAADFIKPNGDPMTEDEIRAKISENYSALCIRDIYNIKRNGTYTPVVSGMTIDANTIVRTRAFRAVQEGVVSSDSEAREIAITDLFSYSLGYADPANPFNEDPDPTDPNYDPDAIVYKKDPDGHIIDFNDISEGTSKELNGAGDFFEMNTSANSSEPLLISDTEITVRGDGTSRFNVFYRRKRFNLKFYYARQGYTNGVLDPNKISLTNSTKEFNNKSNEKEYLKTTSKNVLEAVAMGSWEQNSAETLPQVKDEYKQLVTEGYDDFTDSHYNGYYRYYYYQLQAKYNEPLTNKWLIDALDTVHRKGSAEAEICYPGSIATEYYNKYYQDRSTSGNYTVKGIYEKLDKGILFTDSARATMKQNNIDYTELHFLISWTNTSYNNGWNSSITRVLHFRYENYTELLPREIEIIENNGEQALLNEGNYTDVRQFTTKVNENGSWVTKTKWYGLSTDHIYETIDSGNQYDPGKDKIKEARKNQTPTQMTGFEIEYYRTNSGLITLDDYNTIVDWSQDTTNYRRCTIKFFYRRLEYTLKYRNGNRKDETHTRTVMYGAPINSVYQVSENGHEAGDYRYYWPDPEYFDENRRDFFTFDGWYNDPRYEDPFDLDTQTMPADDDTLFAKWSPKIINVTFYNGYNDFYLDKNPIVLGKDSGGEDITRVPVDYGGYTPTNVIPVDDDSPDNPRPKLRPIATGAMFAGWYYIRNRQPVRFEPEKVPVTALNEESSGEHGELKLYAEWVTKEVAKYRVRYVRNDDPDVEIAPPTIGRAYVSKTKTFNAKSADELYDGYKWTPEGTEAGTNWWPVANSHSFVVDPNDNKGEFSPNEYSFEYIQKGKVHYRVQYLDEATHYPINPGKKDVERESTYASVKEDALNIAGYLPVEATKTLVLTASANTDPGEQVKEELRENVITFLYTKNDTQYIYETEYYIKDVSGGGYTLNNRETLTADIVEDGDTLISVADLYQRPIPVQLGTGGYQLKAGATTYTVTDESGTGEPVSVDDNGTVKLLAGEKKTIKIYLDRCTYPYSYKYVDYTQEKKHNDGLDTSWNGVLSDFPNVGTGVTDEIVEIKPDEFVDYTDPETGETTRYVRIGGDTVPLTIQPDASGSGVNTVKIYYRKDTERELQYKMVCVNAGTTGYQPDTGANGEPLFGRLNINLQTVQSYGDIQNVRFYNNNEEVLRYDENGKPVEYLHDHRYTFLGWYSTPEYDPEHPEKNRLTTDEVLTRDNLGTDSELPVRDTTYYALVSQDMVRANVEFRYLDDITTAEFKALEDGDATVKVDAAQTDSEGERVGAEVVFDNPDGYRNNQPIAWHRSDGYKIHIDPIDGRAYKYEFAEWWEIEDGKLVRKTNWNSAEWSATTLESVIERTADKHIIAVYTRRVVEEMPYVINYSFTDRFGEKKTFAVNGTLTKEQLDEAKKAAVSITDSGCYELTDEFIIGKSPFESNYGETLRWSDRKIEKTSERGDAKEGTADRIITNVEAEQSAKEVYANYKTAPEADAFENIPLTYGDNYELNEDMLAIECTDDSFSYWEVRKSADGDVVARSYSPLFDLCMMDSYYITPVCEGKPDDSAETEKDPTVTLTHLDYTRNRWTDESGAVPSSGDTDLLFTDFEIAFEDNGAQIYGADSEYTAGVVFEKIGTLAESATFTPDKYNYYSEPEALKAAILNNQTSYSTPGTEGGTAKNRKIQLSAIDTANMTNRNRIEFSQYYKNVYNETKKSYTNSRVLMKATAYLIKDSKVTLSNSIYVCLKDIAAKELATGNDIWTVTSQSGD
ncbi:MAG: InlB B-repeat-containing protein, partial [Eubacteriales bacterium]|nr:InlB B-repeat-containing protein [Eubacteriales bacterium]